MTKRAFARGLPVALAALVLIGAESQSPEPAGAGAPEPAPAEAPAPADPNAIDPEAMRTVWRAASFLAAAEGFSYVAESSYDAVQPDGQKIEFGAKRSVLVRRPDHVRVEGERRDGNRGGLAFDGANVTAWDADENVFAVAQKSGDLETLLSYLIEDLDFPVQLAGLVRRDLPQRLVHRVEAASFVGDSRIDGVDCEQIALRNDSTDVQLWIAKGEPPVFRRVVISYRLEEGEPQFRANLSEWNFAPDADDARFAFQPPDGAERIVFAPRRRDAAEEKGAQ